jgi:hypothetical protein
MASLWSLLRKQKSSCQVSDIQIFSNFIMTIIAAFRFHVKGAILGKLVLGFAEYLPLAHLDFIASPLLPCSQLDGPLLKFTGHDDCGTPTKNDHLMMAIHAFAHFVVIYSEKKIMLCDLQGE